MSGIDLNDLRKTGGIIKLQGREFVTYSGLLVTSHSNGLNTIEPVLLDWNAEQQSAVFKATVSGERGTFTAHGDADPNNVKRGMVGAVLRMAETRAVCRALRMYLGIGMTAREELPGDEPAERSPQPRRAPRPAKDTVGSLEWTYSALNAAGVSINEVDAYIAAQKGWGTIKDWKAVEREQFVKDVSKGQHPDLYSIDSKETA